MYEPLVSIIIPVYNGSDYVREAIDSALSQTYRNLEVIVVNDGSRDDGATDEIVRSYGDKVRYFVKENGGVSSALNKGIAEMRGEYFSWLSHDDVYEADKVEKQVAALNTVEKNTLIYCCAMQIDTHSRPIGSVMPASYFKPNKQYDSKEVLTGLLNRSTFNGCCLLIPKEALIKSGLFDEGLRFCQDAFMWYNIFMHEYSLLCTEDVSVKNRIHEKQLTQTGQALFRKECGVISGILAEKFAKISTKDYNFLKMYVYSDARHLQFRQVKAMVDVGKTYRLLSVGNTAKAYMLCAYGKVRPLIRKVYYKVFRKMTTH